MNQILTMLPLFFSSLVGKEKAVILDQGGKYLNLENARLGKPLTDAQVASFVETFATLIIAEESAALALLTAKKV